MNKLQQYIKDNRLNETDVMNALTEMELISDNCISAADVSDVDFDRARKLGKI